MKNELNENQWIIIQMYLSFQHSSMSTIKPFKQHLK